jgi:CrcB protein
MRIYFYVALGGAIGSVLRFLIASSIARSLQEVFPWGTLIVNITGCFVIGLFAAMTGPDGRAISPELRQFVMVGICGGYTTFSSFSLQTLTLAREGDLRGAFLNVIASTTLCLIGVWLGTAAGAAFTRIEGA